MRYAASAVAAISGVFLLGLAFYGQPALYLQQARDQWNELIDGPVTEQPAARELFASPERVAQLQQQVTQLEAALAAKQAPAPPPAAPEPVQAPAPLAAAVQSAPLQLAVPPQPDVVALGSVRPERAVPVVSPPAAEPGPSAITMHERKDAASSEPVLPQPQTAKAEQPKPELGVQFKPEPAVQPKPELATQPKPELAVQPKPELAMQPKPAPAMQPKPAPVVQSKPELAVQSRPELAVQSKPAPATAVPPISEPARSDFASLEPPKAGPAKSDPARSEAVKPEPPKAEAVKSEAVKPEPPRADAAKADTAKSEGAKAESPKAEPPKSGPPKSGVAKAGPPNSELPVPPKLATEKAIPAPPPLPVPPPPREDIDDAQSVMARLRRLAPGSAPVQQADASPPAESRPRPSASPSLPGLASARAALVSGRIEEARRLLQQAQLQLVFRPVSDDGDDSPSANKGSADVAHALEALSANDIPLSHRYIDIAVADLAGTGSNPPLQETQIHPTGYAPAYPPR